MKYEHSISFNFTLNSEHRDPSEVETKHIISALRRKASVLEDQDDPRALFEIYETEQVAEDKTSMEVIWPSRYIAKEFCGYGTGDMRLPKELLDSWHNAGLRIQELIVHTHGGSDQGYYDYSITYLDILKKVKFVLPENLMWHDFEDWCYDRINMSGAGDGSEYGDDIIYTFSYDEDKNQANVHIDTSSWETQKVVSKGLSLSAE